MTEEISRWQLKGTAPQIYDQHIVPAVSVPWYTLFIETGRPYMQGAIADIGCGTGSFLCHLQEQPKVPNETELVGVDCNTEMLAIAEQKVTTISKKISWVNADVNKIPFENNYFNLVYCQQGFQYFTNKVEALTEIHRLIASNGALIATVWSTIEDCVGYKYLSDAVLKIAGDKPKSNLIAPFSYACPETFKELGQGVGFKSVSVQVMDNYVHFPSIKEFVFHRVYGSPLIDDLPKDNREILINEISLELETSLQLYVGKNGLVFPVKANFLFAKK